MLQFPLDEMVDEPGCHAYVLRGLYPDGVPCAHGQPLPAT